MDAAFPCSPAAYCTAALHALKHPTQPVMGLLLGPRASPAATADGGKAAAYASAAVPVAHTEVASAPHPMTEIAVKQVLAVATSSGRRIVGLYAANERCGDNALSEHTAALASFVAGEAGEPITVWLMDNAKLPPGKSEGAAVKLYTAEKTRISAAGSSAALTFAEWDSAALAPKAAPIAGRAIIARLGELVEARKAAAVGDFEEHLENCEVDYFNPWAAAACAME
uniref:MPN domain-containing protein n=1 Tax=Neobodo designis TaxID=312471 RepID=A0A7S1PU66_NEODS